MCCFAAVHRKELYLIFSSVQTQWMKVDELQRLLDNGLYPMLNRKITSLQPQSWTLMIGMFGWTIFHLRRLTQRLSRLFGFCPKWIHVEICCDTTVWALWDVHLGWFGVDLVSNQLWNAQTKVYINMNLQNYVCIIWNFMFGMRNQARSQHCWESPKVLRCRV